MQSSGIAMVLPTLGSNETKESIDAWKIKTKSYLRAIPAYQPYVDTTWTALANLMVTMLTLTVVRSTGIVVVAVAAT